MRKMVKHLLKKYKYPPEDYDTAFRMQNCGITHFHTNYPVVCASVY